MYSGETMTDMSDTDYASFVNDLVEGNKKPLLGGMRHSHDLRFGLEPWDELDRDEVSFASKNYPYIRSALLKLYIDEIIEE